MEPPLCQGLRHRQGQGGPIIHIVPAHLCRLLPDQPHKSALFQAQLTQTARTVTPRQGAYPGPLQPRALVLIPVWTRHASRGAARQNSHPVIARDFCYWSADVRSRVQCPVLRYTPLASGGMAVQAGIRRSNRPHRRLVVANSANLAGGGEGER
jgi:hypothetical protein